MTDLEIITGEKNQLRKAIVYLRENSWLDHEVTSVVAKKHGDPIGVGFDTFCHEIEKKSLLGDRFFVVRETPGIPELKQVLPRVDPDKVLFLMSGKEVKIFDGIDIQVLTETALNKAGFKTSLQYCLIRNGIPEVLISKVAAQNLEELFFNSESVSEFVSKAEVATHVCLNLTGPVPEWDTTLFRNTFLGKSPHKYFHIQEALFFFLIQPTLFTKETLFEAIRAEGEAAIPFLYRAVFDLIGVNRDCNPVKTDSFRDKYLSKFAHLPLPRLSFFLLCLCECETTLVSDFKLGLESLLEKTYFGGKS